MSLRDKETKLNATTEIGFKRTVVICNLVCYERPWRLKSIKELNSKNNKYIVNSNNNEM